MIRKSMLAGLAVVFTILFIQRMGSFSAAAADQAGDPPQKTIPVHLVVTAEPVQDGDAVSAMTQEDVKVKQGKKVLPVTDWIAARGEQAALQMFIIIDETCNTSLGQHLS